MGVPGTIFYRYTGYAAIDHVVEKHGNSGLVKPRPHIVQATATLRYILNKLVDHMPHKSRTLASGEKIVSKVFPASWK